MVCPYYEDFTRVCIEKVPAFTSFINFEYCESDKYNTCFMYLLASGKFFCKNLDSCTKQWSSKFFKFFESIFKNKELLDFARENIRAYCISKDYHIKCARYKLTDRKEKVPVALMPNGKKIMFKDLILKREIIDVDH